MGKNGGLFHLLDWKEEGRPTGRVIGVKQVNIYQTFAKREKKLQS
jgi:hypothetical protein